MVKYLVLTPSPAGWYVVGCYGLALVGMAREKARSLVDSRIIKAATDASAGSTLRRMPAGFESVAA